MHISYSIVRTRRVLYLLCTYSYYEYITNNNRTMPVGPREGAREPTGRQVHPRRLLDHWARAHADARRLSRAPERRRAPQLRLVLLTAAARRTALQVGTLSAAHFYTYLRSHLTLPAIVQSSLVLQ